MSDIQGREIERLESDFGAAVSLLKELAQMEKNDYVVYKDYASCTESSGFLDLMHRVHRFLNSHDLP